VVIALDIGVMLDIIKNYGFPIFVACWALWRLNKTYSNESTNVKLTTMEDTLDRVEEMAKKNTEILTELVTTMKIIQTIIGGEVRK
jgi:hypothetical protein